MHIIQEYLSNLLIIRRSGMAVQETSYYGTLETLLNRVGNQLKPSVRAIINTKNTGAGIPDGGLFSKDQFSKEQHDFRGMLPSRGVIEIKGTSEKIDTLANSEQVTRYLNAYGQVLVTNYYQFILMAQDRHGKPTQLEKYLIAENEADFWESMSDPSVIASAHEVRLIEFLLRVMLQPASLTEPKDVAWFLASYAKDARARIDQLELPALNNLREALRETLGITFPDKKGDSFFKSTLIQTLFYGVFSSWLLYEKNARNKTIDFDWRLAGWYIKVPLIRALFTRVANPDELGRLGLIEVLDWTCASLNRINADIFLAKFEESDAVLYFYEPFLEAFDKHLRKDLGVWYTPPEIVKYMVERVDLLLKQELHIKRGLADENVYVLDPACGTGAYVIEVLRTIHATLKDEGNDALVGQDLKEAITRRIFGFEILPAPFIVAHMQIGILMDSLGVGFKSETDRAAVYLTNALTGWDPPKEKGKQLVAFPEMQQEKDAADEVKQRKPILVIIGNPPYNAFKNAITKEEGDIVSPYKKGLVDEWRITKRNLNDLYIRFFRLAEKRIAEASGRGIVSYITNFSFLRDPQNVVMRKHFLESFDSIYIDCMNGDSRETGKKTPEGFPDPSVFSTKFNRIGIKKGTAVTTLIKNEVRLSDETKELTGTRVHFRQFWGVTKNQDLYKSLHLANYELLSPEQANWYRLHPFKVGHSSYSDWIRISELAKKYFTGLEECRGGDLFDIRYERLRDRMSSYYDVNSTFEQVKKITPGLGKKYSGFDPLKVRNRVLSVETFDERKILGYVTRPFEKVFCYYTSASGVWNRSRPDLIEQISEENVFLITRFNCAAKNEGIPATYSRGLFDKQAINRNPIAIPFLIKQDKINPQADLFRPENASGGFMPNLSDKAKLYLAELGHDVRAEIVWLHCFAILYCESYLAENRTSLSTDFPRIPLPDQKELLSKTAEVGRKLIKLLDTDEEVPETDILKIIGVVTSVDGRTIDTDDLYLEADWGRKTSVVMPGPGKYDERSYSDVEYEEFEKIGLSPHTVKELLGNTTFDVFMNDQVYWKNIPIKIWEYHIGGYQVIKKFLSYREKSIINRPFNRSEVRYISNIARRISAIRLLQPELAMLYEEVKANTFLWEGSSEEESSEEED